MQPVYNFTKMKNILLLGSGGRECALAWKLSQSPLCGTFFIAPGNAGTSEYGINLPIQVNDFAAIRQACLDYKIDILFPGPEDPLVAGIYDYFKSDTRLKHIIVVGPSKDGAQLEGSKAFSKKFMARHCIPTAAYQEFTADSFERGVAYIKRSEPPYVIKADGLAAGKGVVVCSSNEEAREAIKRMLLQREFGEAGLRVVVEDRLEGEEASLLAFVDGNTIVPLEAAQDHKAAFDGDLGPNTGGMGAYSPTPIITDEIVDTVVEKILIPIVHEMNKEGRPFRGCLYAGLMLTSQGPKVLEFNVRLGDPETQAVLMRLKSDLALTMYAVADGKLDQIEPLDWDPRPSLCVVMASGGYPGDYETGHPIRGLEEAALVPETKVFHAGTRRIGDQIVNDGGRVLGVTAIGDTISEAKLRAYQAVKCIRWDGAWCRKDISDKANRY